MFRCCIIDDDPQVIDLVSHFADKCTLIDYCVACTEPVEGLKLLNNGNYDLLLLDYNMPSMNGQDILELKRDKSKVIMITSNIDFAARSYRYDEVVDYLVKPLSFDIFDKAVKRIYERSLYNVGGPSRPQENNNTIMVKDGNNWIPVSLNTVQFIKSDSNYCIFQGQDSKVMTLASLKSLEEKLPTNFIRCHRSYIINTKYITRINLDEVTVGNETIPISAGYRDQIKAYIHSMS